MIYKKVLDQIIDLPIFHYFESPGQRVITFHGTEKHPSHINCSPILFENLVKIIIDKDLKTSTASQLSINENYNCNNQLYITFDDGALSNVEIAKLFHKHSISATFFITTDLIEKKLSVKDLQNEYANQVMNFEDINFLSEMGFEIGSHTVSHSNLRMLSDEAIYNELFYSKIKIEDIICKRVDVLSYPFGHLNSYDHRVKDIARQIGYKYCFSQVKKRICKNTNPFEIPRIGINGYDSLRVLYNKIMGRYDFLYLIEEIYIK